MASFESLPTPSVLVNQTRVLANISSMQAACSAQGIELRPHIKTHKMVAVAKEQLKAGAAGLTCAKIGEAEAMIPSGVRSLFIAHSLVDPLQAPRLAALAEKLDDLRVAVTSEGHVEALAKVATATGRTLSVMMAVDTGLGREGVRTLAAAERTAQAISRSGVLQLAGFYTHEGYFYGLPVAEQKTKALAMIEFLTAVRSSIDAQLPLWPGCSVTARLLATLAPGTVQAVRPGAYVFGDLSLSVTTGVMQRDEVALHVLATVVDKPEAGLALIDAGSKTFSSDKTAEQISAIAADGRDIKVVRVNEEHGYIRGSDVDQLKIGERVIFIPAHVCTVVNLTDHVIVTDGHQVIDHWQVQGRGRVQ